MLLALLAPGERGRSHAEGIEMSIMLMGYSPLEGLSGTFSILLLSEYIVLCGNILKNLIGGGAAGGAPAPQLGLPHLVRYQAYSIVTVTMCLNKSIIHDHSKIIN